MRVLLLAGGLSNEREVSLRSGATIANVLKSLDYEYQIADPADKKFNLLSAAKRSDVVFIALHGKHGEDGEVQKVLEDAKIPFTGSGFTSSKLCSDKWKYKKFLSKNDIPSPKGSLVSLHRKKNSLFENSYVLKPCDEGSSLDTLIVRVPTAENLVAAERLLENHEEMLLEELIIGTEITVGILGSEPLPIIEIIPPKNEEFDYDNKYNGKTQELCPPKNVSKNLQSEAQKLALKIHELTGCQDMSRTDIMIDPKGNMYVLETNTIPGLTDQSLLPKMVQAAGLSMEDLVQKLLSSALNRQS